MLMRFARVLLLSTLVTLSASAETIFQYPSKIGGTPYLLSVDKSDFAETPRWRSFESEPPVLPARAAKLAFEALTRQFGTRVKAELFTITLTRTFDGECVYYDVVFQEKLSLAEMKERERVIATGKTDGGSYITAEVPRDHFRYLVLLSGRVIVPKKSV
jgi:hypothetical protein